MISILEGLPFFESDYINRETKPVETFDQVREIVCWGYDSGFIMLLDDVLTTIEVHLYYDVELNDLIKQMGEPAGYFAYTFPHPDAIRIGPGCVNADVQNIWPEHGLIAITTFDTRDPPRRGGKLFSGSDRHYLRGIIYSAPASNVLEYLLARGRYETSAEDDIEWYYQAWQGGDQITLPVTIRTGFHPPNDVGQIQDSLRPLRSFIRGRFPGMNFARHPT